MTTKELLALGDAWTERARLETPLKAAVAIQACADELAPIATALCAEVEALRADKARLDWLESKPDDFANIDRITSVGGKFNCLPTLRAAIDAARSRNEHEG